MPTRKHALHHQPESVAVNVHNLDHGIVFQILAKLGKVHIHAAAVEVSITVPDTFQGLFSEAANRPCARTIF